MSVYSSATSKATIGYEKEKWNIAESLSEVEFAGQKAAYQREKWGKLESTVADALEVVSTLGGMMEDKQVFEEEYLPGAQEAQAKSYFEEHELERWGVSYDELKGDKDMYSAYLSEFEPQKLEKKWWDVLGETEYKFGEKGGTYSKGIISATGRHRKGAADISALLGEDVSYTTAADILGTGDDEKMIDEVSKNVIEASQGSDFDKLKEDAKKLQAAKDKAAKDKALLKVLDPSVTADILAKDYNDGGQGPMAPDYDVDKSIDPYRKERALNEPYSTTENVLLRNVFD